MPTAKHPSMPSKAHQCHVARWSSLFTNMIKGIDFTCVTQWSPMVIAWTVVRQCLDSGLQWGVLMRVVSLTRIWPGFAIPIERWAQQDCHHWWPLMMFFVCFARATLRCTPLSCREWMKVKPVTSPRTPLTLGPTGHPLVNPLVTSGATETTGQLGCWILLLVPSWCSEGSVKLWSKQWSAMVTPGPPWVKQILCVYTFFQSNCQQQVQDVTKISPVSLNEPCLNTSHERGFLLFIWVL